MSETIADIVAAHKREQGNAVKMPHFDYAVLDVKVGNGTKMREALAVAKDYIARMPITAKVVPSENH